jgi:hypothetical protein
MKCCLVLAAQFQIWDGLMTHIFVNNGLVQEANPLMSSLVSGGNFLLLKVIGVLLCLPILWLVYKYFPRLALTSTVSLVVLYAAILAWNFTVVLNTI